ncbi:homing endonuclease [Vibrio phage D479]
MYHIIYKTTNTINQRYYIGLHSTTDLNDGYLGSGNLIKRAIAKYGKQWFVREILYEFPTREEAAAKESEIVNEEFIALQETYNLALGGLYNEVGGMRSEETKQKLSEIAKNRQFSDETRLKMSKSQTGRKHSEDTKRKMSESAKELHSSDKSRGERLAEYNKKRASDPNYISPNKGKKLSDEARQRLRDAKLKNQRTYTCEHCGKQTTNAAMHKRWHSDNCKFRD